MKIIIYTIADCQYSKAEKDYLASHTLPYEEKNLETNKEFLTEMMTVSNNFAGTPVTKVEKDDGTIVVLKGFTQEEFDKTLGFGTPVEEIKPAEPVNQVPTGNLAPTSNKDPLQTVLNTLEAKAEPVAVQPPTPASTDNQVPTGNLASPVNPVSNIQSPTSNPTPSIPDFQPTTPNS